MRVALRFRDALLNMINIISAVRRSQMRSRSGNLARGTASRARLVEDRCWVSDFVDARHW